MKHIPLLVLAMSVLVTLPACDDKPKAPEKNLVAPEKAAEKPVAPVEPAAAEPAPAEPSDTPRPTDEMEGDNEGEADLPEEDSDSDFGDE